MAITMLVTSLWPGCAITGGRHLHHDTTLITSRDMSQPCGHEVT